MSLLTARLIDSKTSAHLWSQHYDRQLRDVFDIQDDIAASVAEALALELGDAGASHEQPDPRAYDKALMARFLFGRRGPGDLDRSRDAFKSAIALDPGFAQAWSGLAGVY